MQQNDVWERSLYLFILDRKPIQREREKWIHTFAFACNQFIWLWNGLATDIYMFAFNCIEQVDVLCRIETIVCWWSHQRLHLYTIKLNAKRKLSFSKIFNNFIIFSSIGFFFSNETKLRDVFEHMNINNYTHKTNK